MGRRAENQGEGTEMESVTDNKGSRKKRTPALRRRAALIAVCTAMATAAPAATRASAERTTSLNDVASAIGRGVGVVQEGLVSWYGAAFHDRPTASGELFDSGELTMAHRTLPFGTKVRVTNLRNGRSVVVRVNDRGPFVGQRIADLSHAAAEQIGLVRRGVTKARIEVIGQSR
jgi:rare lipoprotein A